MLTYFGAKGKSGAWEHTGSVHDNTLADELAKDFAQGQEYFTTTDEVYYHERLRGLPSTLPVAKKARVAMLGRKPILAAAMEKTKPAKP